jgi:hypothetical protein
LNLLRYVGFSAGGITRGASHAPLNRCWRFNTDLSIRQSPYPFAGVGAAVTLDKEVVGGALDGSVDQAGGFGQWREQFYASKTKIPV